ncbi:MAG TPA: M3 family oligoendopeptidase [Phycisphaerales bacterium]|nr:M3 family oligoendopeptidase [Phycisphaerales bacterium]
MPTISTTLVPADLDATRFDALEPLFKALLERPVRSAEELEAWLLDRSELAAACSEGRANLYISMSCDTDGKAAQQAYASYIENVAPRLTPLFFELDKRLVELAKKFPLDAGRYGVLLRAAQADVELFREENVPLETELAKLSQKYDQIAGAMSVQFEGEEKTLPQMAKYQELPDRAKREAAWRTVMDRRFQDVTAINDVYEEMVALRTKVGRNAGFEDYVGYAFKSKHRFDYGVEACRQFHAGVEEAIVPLVREFDRKRAADLKLDALRPWDFGVDPKGRGPLKPFNGGKDLMDKSLATFRRLDARLAEMFARLGTGEESRGARDGACLDLDSRKGKAPGGYQYMRDRTRRPFIFMNAAGMHKDVETMVHEAGHAFHSMLCEEEPLVEYRHSPIEFAEVASMSMELLSMPHWRSFYASDEDWARAAREQLKHSLLLLPWIAQIDAFQLWVYGNPKHTREERATFWLGLDERFGSRIDWTGLEKYRRWIWQRQLHLFSHPFYYIEYGIARLGALQLWLHSLEKGEKSAVELYIKGLSLGGSRPLPELFRASGLTFDFGPDAVKRIAERVRVELDKLPE